MNNHYPHRLLATSLALACLPMCLSAGDFSLGVHSGVAQHAPELESLDTLDGDSHSWSVSAGYDLTPHLAVEAEYADLGTMVVTDGSTATTLDSHETNVSVLWRGYRQQDSSDSEDGLSVYGRLGASYMTLDQSDYSETQTRVLLGAGSQYDWANGVGARAEVNLRDNVFHQLQFGLIKRFGANEDDHEQVMASRHLSVPAPRDDEALWENRLSLSMPTLIFREDQSLDSEQQAALTTLAHQLQRQEQLKLVINGHSDSRGSQTEKLQRGRAQAIKVGRLLQAQGISGKRLHIRTYGDTLPFRNNRGDIVDAYSRRVDFDIYTGE